MTQQELKNKLTSVFYDYIKKNEAVFSEVNIKFTNDNYGSLTAVSYDINFK